MNDPDESNSLKADGEFVGRGTVGSHERERSTRELNPLDDLKNSSMEYLDPDADEDEPDNPEWATVRKGRFDILVVRESNAFRQIWSIIIAVLLVYTGTVFPYRLCFVDLGFHDIPTSDSWKVVEIIADGIFYIDLGINFFFSYRNSEGREVMSLCDVAKRYLQTYFTLNLIACIPPSFIGFLVDTFANADHDNSGESTINKSARLARLQRISRLARLTRLTRLTKLFGFVKDNPVWRMLQTLRGVRVINFFGGLLWVVHLVACGWNLCAAMHEDQSNTWVYRRGIEADPPLDQWFHANYFVLTVFTTVGFGDISASTLGEIVYVQFTMVLGTVVHSIIISEVINIVMSVDQAAADLSQQKDLVKSFVHHAELDQNVSKDLMNFFDQYRERRSRFDRDKMRSLFAGITIPRELMSGVIGALFNGRLEGNQFITCCLHYEKRMPPRFPLCVALAVNQRHFVSKEMAYCAYDQPWNLFLVMKGTFANLAFPTMAGGLADLPPECIALPKKAFPSRDDTMGTSRDLAIQSTGSSSYSPPKRQATTDAQPKRPGTVFNALGARRGAKDVPRSDLTQDSERVRQAGLFPYQLFGLGTYFGDLEILCSGTQRSRFSSCRCESDYGGILLMLHRKELTKLMEDFPRFATAWRSRAKRREEHREILVGRLTKGLKLKDFAASVIQGMVRVKFFNHEAPSQGQVRRPSQMGLTVTERQVDNDNSRQRMQQQQQSLEFAALRKDMILAMSDMRQEMLGLLRPAVDRQTSQRHASTRVVSFSNTESRAEIDLDQALDQIGNRLGSDSSQSTPADQTPVMRSTVQSTYIGEEGEVDLSLENRSL